MATITSNFTVSGVSFPEWFNAKFKGNALFPQINVANFKTVFGTNFEKLTGKKEISLTEFCGHVAIILNETGGTFKPLREMGGPAYCFNTVMPKGQTKKSYNIKPNRLAGDQLKEWGVISTPEDVALWNGTVYPTTAPANVLEASQKCDFYRYRGYGFNQLTFKDAYERCVQPLLPKPMDSYSVEEFEKTLNDFGLACAVFHNYVNTSPVGKKAMVAIEQGDFRPYGMMVSGGWVGYVNNHYLPRCNGIYTALQAETIVNVPVA